MISCLSERRISSCQQYTVAQCWATRYSSWSIWTFS